MTDGPPGAVFIHPIALDHRATGWLDVPDLHAVTLRGHGDREPAAQFSLGDLADELAGWIHEPVHLIGCSMGGMVAMHFALRHPALVASMLIGFTTARASRDAMLERAHHASAEAAAVETTLARWFTPDALAADPAPPGVAYARERLQRTSPLTVAAGWRAIADHDVLDALPELRMPVTVVAGTADVSSSFEGLEDIARRIPRAELLVMNGAPHMAFLQSPAAFSRMVNAHLHRAGAAS